MEQFFIELGKFLEARQIASTNLVAQNTGTYNGIRLAPDDTTANGFHIEKNTNTNIGFSAINTDDVGNASQANLYVKGKGAEYTNYTGLSHYNSNYYVPYLRNAGLLFSDKKLHIGTWNNNDIEFRSGNTFPTMSLNFLIKANGKISIPKTPTVDTEVNNILGRKIDGEIVVVEGALRITNNIPTSSTSPGKKGETSFDSLYQYIWISDNQCVRKAIESTF